MADSPSSLGVKPQPLPPRRSLGPQSPGTPAACLPLQSAKRPLPQMGAPTLQAEPHPATGTLQKSSDLKGSPSRTATVGGSGGCGEISPTPNRQGTSAPAAALIQPVGLSAPLRRSSLVAADTQETSAPCVGSGPGRVPSLRASSSRWGGPAAVSAPLSPSIDEMEIPSQAAVRFELSCTLLTRWKVNSTNTLKGFF